MLHVRPRILVGLVGDHPLQAGRRCAARDLFRAQVVRMSQLYAETYCDDWAFLSAEHGVLSPWTEVSPYEGSLRLMKANARRDWAATCGGAIEGIWADAEFLVLGGPMHAEAVSSLPHRTVWGAIPAHMRVRWLRGVLDARAG